MQGIKYGNLFDYIISKTKEGVHIDGLHEGEMTEKEFRDALRVLEDDNVITLNGHSSHPVIRFNTAV